VTKYRGYPRSRSVKNLESIKYLVTHRGSGTGPVVEKSTNTGSRPKKQAQTVTAQFQTSLHTLMIALNEAHPFFIRCIKSNAEKVPGKFDDTIIQRQLRYTGMLETVRIRRAGYNVRLTFEDFKHHYRILLPNGLHR
jgi:myosin-9